MSSDGFDYSIKKIFIILFVLTAVEVAIGVLIDDPRWLKWTGLLVLAVWKGALILMYFMHMKYEKLIVWSLIAPTPILVAVVVFALMPDVSFKDQERDFPVGHQLDQTGKVVNMIESRPAASHGDDHGEDGGH